MFTKHALYRLPWEKIALVIAAVALIAASLWFGDKSLYSGSLSKIVNRQQVAQVGNGTSIFQDDYNSFVDNISINPTNRMRYASRTPMTFSFRVNHYVRRFMVTIQKTNGEIVKSFDYFTERQPGYYQNTYTWDGTGTFIENGITRSGDVPEGTYYLTFSAEGQTSVRRFIYVDNGNGNSLSTTIFRDAYLAPQNGIINADADEHVRLYYYLNRPAHLTFEIWNEADTQRVVRIVDNEYRSTVGAYHTYDWKGRQSGDQYNNNAAFTRVNGGKYQLRLIARDGTGAVQSQSFTVTVNRNGSNNSAYQISQMTVDPPSLDVRNAPTIRFIVSVNQSPITNVVAHIYDAAGSRLVNSLVLAGGCNGYGATVCTFSTSWDGFDRFTNSFVYPGTYRFKFEATHPNAGIIRTERDFQVVQASLAAGNYQNPGTVYYDQFGRPVVTNPYLTNPYATNPYLGTSYTPRCRNFSDVEATDALCNAVQFAVDKGIISGYQDGTIGLKNTIRRAEFLAIVASAFKYSLDQYNPQYDRNLGYFDLTGKEGEWYMSHIKTFARLGIMRGYPDNTLKPEKTMTTAELYVSLFRAAFEAPTRPARFTLPSDSLIHRPYDDTPVTSATRWYIRHAQFARLTGLVKGNTFNPSKGITRGQVIKLIYDMHQKRLLSL